MNIEKFSFSPRNKYHHPTPLHLADGWALEVAMTEKGKKSKTSDHKLVYFWLVNSTHIPLPKIFSDKHWRPFTNYNVIHQLMMFYS